MGPLSHLTPEQIAAWVTASCLAQGVPVKVTDPATVSTVRTLLGGPDGRTATARQRGRSAPAGPPTDATPE